MDSYKSLCDMLSQCEIGNHSLKNNMVDKLTTQQEIMLSDFIEECDIDMFGLSNSIFFDIFSKELTRFTNMLIKIDDIKGFL